MAVLLSDPVMQAWNKKVPVVMAEFLPLLTRQMAVKRLAFEKEVEAIVAEYGIDLEPGTAQQ